MPGSRSHPSIPRAALVALALALSTSACAPGLFDDDETATDGGSSSTEGPTESTSAPGSAEAGAVRSAATADPELPTDVVTFIQNAPDARIDELGQLVCGQSDADMTAAQFGQAAIVARDELTEDEKADLDLAEFGTAFRLLAESYCPDQVPPGLDEEIDEVVPDTTMATQAPPDTEAPTDTEAAGGAAPVPTADQLAAYRSVLSSFLEPDHPAIAFADSAGDDRLGALAQKACTDTDPSMTEMELGLIILESYTDDLSEAEQGQFDAEQYGELYGSLLGFFCPEKLPDVAGAG